jgi:hypothetical protein
MSNRLHLRFTRLLARRLQRNKAKVAVARELCGFIWALLRNLDCYRQETPTTAPKKRGNENADHRNFDETQIGHYKVAQSTARVDMR